MPNVANVLSAQGIDLAPIINTAAARAGIDPVWLLALIMAESGERPDPLAERWGHRTADAKAAIAAGDTTTIANIITEVWPDISFGCSQRVIMYHDAGDRTPRVGNVLAVRQVVFEDPGADIAAAARRLAHGIEQSTDRTPLGGMAVYNGGADRRNDPAWMANWAGNIASYERCLTLAAGYAVTEAPGPTPAEEWANALDVLRGWSRQLAQASREVGDVADIVERLRERV